MTALIEPPAAASTVMDEPSRRLWTRDEYERLAEEGLFSGQRVQLFQGVIYQTPPQGLLHSLAVERFENFFRSAFPQGHRFRIQMPFHSADGSEPEPDIAVISGSLKDPIVSHPTNAVIVIEVSDTSLRFDRAKAVSYALSGIPEYWIVNLASGTIEVYREPSVAPTSELPYQVIRAYSSADLISPAAAPQMLVKVNDLLP